MALRLPKEITYDGVNWVWLAWCRVNM